MLLVLAILFCTRTYCFPYDYANEVSSTFIFPGRFPEVSDSNHKYIREDLLFDRHVSYYDEM